MMNELHYVNSNRAFNCLKCKFFKRNFGADNKTCRLTNKLEYEINDGDCPLKYDDYLIVNWYIGSSNPNK